MSFGVKFGFSCTIYSLYNIYDYVSIADHQCEIITPQWTNYDFLATSDTR